MAAEEPQKQSDRLPFEPARKRQKPPKVQASATQETKAQPNRKLTKREKEEIAIPKVVSSRMARRMAGSTL